MQVWAKNCSGRIACEDSRMGFQTQLALAGLSAWSAGAAHNSFHIME
jgi:hypothetical protein